ncbi:MAG TPA: ATP-binding cassette domain-containing protein [Bacillota bacterium]|nr:ABC transporter ATP-binding protein [Bacillota bacterium]HOA15106.1 ATP-binding cassette domain-containing protein [Bacillota bacterium]HOG52320.1 ATP-binding cassette domain-containing protein [Bacillota bacterium]
MAEVKVTGLCKSYEGRPVFSGVDMTFLQGEVTAVLGPSGRGKTTLIRVLCGLEKQDSGEVRMPPGMGCSVAFQEPRLLPWLTVDGNMEYCLGRHGADRARALLDELGLKDSFGRYPGRLSGGEQQRVNLARALASDGKLLLLDESFNSIGLAMKSWLLPMLRKRASSEGRTTVLVTHSPLDVALMADRFYLMDSEGRGASGPFDIRLEDDARRLEDEATGREVHRLMMLMSELETGGITDDALA